MENDNEKTSANPLLETGNFIHTYINEDLEGRLHHVHTRFPPEPNGYLHIGHAKAINLNYSLAKIYGGKFNLRFDDTNPAKEETEFVDAIIEDIKWLGCDFEDRLFFGSDYFERICNYAIKLIKDGKAFVCDLSPDEMREYRGSLGVPGKNSPYRNRTIEENLTLFQGMKNGDFPEGSRTLRAKIDMSSPNINMRDPVLYRILNTPHHRTGDTWKIYPMYDFAHPIQDAIEGITHSLCSAEYEDHRPLYDWVINEIAIEHKPRQVEFAKLQLNNTIMGKRYLKALVDNGEVDGWDDPRMATVSGMRRRGYTPEAINSFLEKIGVSKANSTVDYGFLEHCVRDDLKLKSKVLMAVIDPVKLVITNYPENTVEYLPIENNQEVPEMGERQAPFSRELYIERSDYMENAPNKFHRLTDGREVRLKGAYFVKCTGCVKDEAGNVVEVHAEYDPQTKSGSGFTGRKVKGTIHWVSAAHSVKAAARIIDFLVFDDENSENGVRKNPDSLVIHENCRIEPYILEADRRERFQFIRNGYFYEDSKLSQPDSLVFNQVVALKSSYRP